MRGSLVVLMLAMLLVLPLGCGKSAKKQVQGKKPAQVEQKAGKTQPKVPQAPAPAKPAPAKPAPAEAAPAKPAPAKPVPAKAGQTQPKPSAPAKQEGGK